MRFLALQCRKDDAGTITKIRELAGPPAIQTYAFGAAYVSTFLPETYRMSVLGDMKMEFQDALVANGGFRQNADDGMPVTVYEGYPDYAPTTAKTFLSSCSKMVMGELPMTAWDDYVKQWYEKGGKVVVERATAWYKTVHNIK